MTAAAACEHGVASLPIIHHPPFPLTTEGQILVLNVNVPVIHSTASFIRLSDHLALGRGGAGLLLRLPLLEPSFLLRSE